MRALVGSPDNSRRPFPAFSLKAGRFLHAHSAEAEAAVEIARELARPIVFERTEGSARPPVSVAHLGQSTR